MQKNWRKLISIRHCRRVGERAMKNDVVESRNETKPAQQTNDSTEEENTVDAAKKELQELELKLQGLTDQKHAKFQLLKDILVEEAKSKTTGGGTPASVTTTTKKRVEVQKLHTLLSPANIQGPASLTETANSATTTGSNVPGKVEAYGY